MAPTIFSSTAPSPCPRYAGPFLRYCGVDQLRSVWRGSVLIVSLESSTPQCHIKTVSPSSPITAASSWVIPAVQIDHFNGFHFWRFDLELPMLADRSSVFEYSVDADRSRTWQFHVAAANDKQWRWCFTSCNGFSGDVKPETRIKMGGLESLWRDLLKNHQEKPFYTMVGGGDQIYCDPVWKLPLLLQWLQIKGRDNRKDYPWNADLDAEVSNFYFDIYMRHYNIPGFKDAAAIIPILNILDDHDLWDGAGSYPEYLEKSHMFMNLKRIAMRFYLLFQQHTTPAFAANEGYLGVSYGSYSHIKTMGTDLAILLVDARGERTRNQIVSPATWNLIFAELEKLPQSIRHLMVITGVPLIYPRMEVADKLLGSLGNTKVKMNKGFNKTYTAVGKGIGKVFGAKAKQGFLDSMSRVKKGLGKTGLMKSVLNHFGEPELMDDLIDHWTHANHEIERTETIMKLQALSASRRLRVTFVAGDVHCAAVGRMSANEDIPDHRLMYQVTSSAIGNVPPPNAVLRGLQKNATNPIPFNSFTKEDMVPLFGTDVDGKERGIDRLMGRRNWCAFESGPNGSLKFSIQVENKDYNMRSKAYSMDIPLLR